jgi:outer membrane lipase/esterase
MSLISFPAQGWRRACLGAIALAALTACGGGTSQYEPFVAQRLISFGDESSALIADPAKPGGGRKYSVNVIVTTDKVDSIDCLQQPIWVQAVANVYGFAFKECNPNKVADPKAATYAALGAKVADLEAQIAQVGGFRDKDLVTVLLGANDVLAVYKPYESVAGAVPEEAMIAEMRARGEQLANLVNTIVGLGAKVIIATVPDLGYSPYALAEDVLSPGRAALLSRMTTAFNEQLGVKIVLDGSLVGLVQGDQMIQSMARSPGSFGLSNNNDAVCKVAPPDCTTKTLIESGDAATYLWADATRLSYGGHAYLGTLAQGRAQNNPF